MFQFGSSENEWEQMEFDLILGRIEKEGIQERNCLILEVVANCFNFTMMYHARFDSLEIIIYMLISISIFVQF